MNILLIIAMLCRQQADGILTIHIQQQIFQRPRVGGCDGDIRIVRHNFNGGRLFMQRRKIFKVGIAHRNSPENANENKKGCDNTAFT
ncbi:TPA: hypothetical protein PPN73_001993 [Serratia rubidaea]|nr:hypothetical protein [Serratia rubidaea]